MFVQDAVHGRLNAIAGRSRERWSSITPGLTEVPGVGQMSTGLAAKPSANQFATESRIDFDFKRRNTENVIYFGLRSKGIGGGLSG